MSSSPFTLIFLGSLSPFILSVAGLGDGFLPSGTTVLNLFLLGFATGASFAPEPLGEAEGSVLDAEVVVLIVGFFLPVPFFGELPLEEREKRRGNITKDHP